MPINNKLLNKKKLEKRNLEVKKDTVKTSERKKDVSKDNTRDIRKPIGYTTQRIAPHLRTLGNGQPRPKSKRSIR